MQQAEDQSSEALEETRSPTPIRETPQAVVDRMFQRILLFTGVPLFIGIALLPLFYVIRVHKDDLGGFELPMWVVYISQLITFGGALLGISYGVLSTSWDPYREGSFWGWTEVKANLPLLLNRNKTR